MKAVVQRVVQGGVTIGAVEKKINAGLVILLGVKQGDTLDDVVWTAEKCLNLRIFEDSAEKMNLSIQDINGSALVISQFTLYADTKKGNRPSFINAAPPDIAEKLYNVYVEALRRGLGEDRVQTGVFRASMQVELVNDGPVTVELTTD